MTLWWDVYNTLMNDELVSKKQQGFYPVSFMKIKRRKLSTETTKQLYGEDIVGQRFTNGDV